MNGPWLISDNAAQKDRLAGYRGTVVLVCTLVISACAFSLLLHGGLRNGFLEILNRLCRASEKATPAYRYHTFAVPEGTSIVYPAVSLILILVSLAVLTVLSKRASLPILWAALIAGLQAYFGLALPVWANILVFSATGLLAAKGLLSLRSIGACAAMIMLLTVFIAFILPGVHPAVEAASERVRDLFGKAAGSAVMTAADEEEGQNSARHVNSQTLDHGQEGAKPEREYRLTTREQVEISLPRWVDYLKITLLLILTVAVLVLPFLPFLFINSRRKKALEKRQDLASEDNGKAITAAFRLVNGYLSVQMKENTPVIRKRADALSSFLPEGYITLYRDMIPVFEEAAYSGREPSKEGREMAEKLLNETETLLYDEAGFKQRLLLRYRWCLHV